MPDTIGVNITLPLPTIAVTVSSVAVSGESSTTQIFEAGETISSGNALYANNGLAYQFDSSNQNLQGRFLGIAKTASIQGGLVEVFTNGIATVSGWGLTPNAIYYAGENGAIATTPSGVLSEMVGMAITSDKLLIKTLSIKTV